MTSLGLALPPTIIIIIIPWHRRNPGAVGRIICRVNNFRNLACRYQRGSFPVVFIDCRCYLHPAPTGSLCPCGQEKRRAENPPENEDVLMGVCAFNRRVCCVWKRATNAGIEVTPRGKKLILMGQKLHGESSFLRHLCSAQQQDSPRFSVRGPASSSSRGELSAEAQAPTRGWVTLARVNKSGLRSLFLRRFH